MVNPKMMPGVFDRCTAIIADRQKLYGDDIPDIEVSLNFATSKLYRAKRTLDKEKMIDDYLDAINYIAFAVLKLEEQK